MKIKKMTATFGRLEGAALTLDAGLNILEAPNEGGKSTWCAFLRAMLYGIPTKERDRVGYVAEKNRYQPWSGSPMEGSMDLEWDGRAITLRRFQKGGAPFGGFEAVDTATGAPVPALTAENAGEVLLGVPRPVFERSAFVGQSSLTVDADPELEKRIAALFSSGEEDVSYSSTERRLKDWQNRRRHNKSGLIPKLEGERSDLDALLSRLDRAGRALADLEGERALLERRKTELEAEAAGQRARMSEARRAEYGKAADFFRQCRDEVSALTAESGPLPDKETLRSAQGELAYYNTLGNHLKAAESEYIEAKKATEEAGTAVEDPLFEGLTGAEAWERAAADRARLERGRKSWWAAAVLALVLLSSGILVWLKLEVWLLLPAAVCFIVFLLELFAGRREKRVQRDILRRYRARNAEEITLRASDFREKRAEADRAGQRVKDIFDRAERTQEERQALLKKLLELVHPFAPEVTDPFGVSAALSKALSLDERLSTARVKLEGAERLMASLPPPEDPSGEAVPSTLEHTPQETAAMLAAVRGELGRAEAEAARAQAERDILGDPVALEARRGVVEEELRRRTAEYDALALALETLAEANAELQTRFAPALNRRSGELFAALTGGKYQDVALSKDFDAAAREAGAVLPRRALLLSRGTVDQLYLAVRLAVCELALPGGDPAPLVLDDALVHFDDERMALALVLLRKLAGERQILLFTCHTRERAALGPKKG